MSETDNIFRCRFSWHFKDESKYGTKLVNCLNLGML